MNKNEQNNLHTWPEKVYGSLYGIDRKDAPYDDKTAIFDSKKTRAYLNADNVEYVRKDLTDAQEAKAYQDGYLKACNDMQRAIEDLKVPNRDWIDQYFDSTEHWIANRAIDAFLNDLKEGKL